MLNKSRITKGMNFLDVSNIVKSLNVSISNNINEEIPLNWPQTPAEEITVCINYSYFLLQVFI